VGSEKASDPCVEGSNIERVLGKLPSGRYQLLSIEHHPVASLVSQWALSTVTGFTGATHCSEIGSPARELQGESESSPESKKG
jgi:hypothetical protein